MSGLRGRRSSGAGRFAEDRHRELRGRYRRRILPRLLLVVLPFAVCGLLLTAISDGHLRWFGGFLCGSAAALFIAGWDSPPAHIERWRTGAEGERRTGRALRQLQRHGWHVFHDLEWPGAGNIDHLVIGPGGIYVLDTKAWAGIVSVDATGATVTPADNPDAAWTARGQTARMSRAGAAVARALAARTGLAVPAPIPVVVVWAVFPQRVAMGAGTAYVDGEHVAAWLLARPRQLHQDQVAQLAEAAGGDLLQRTTASA